MSSGRGSNRGSRIIATLTSFCVVGVTAWFIGGCSGASQKPAEKTTETTTKTTSETTDGDVHVKVDLPDTITIKP